MKCLIVALSALLLAQTGYSRQAGILDFFTHADSVCQLPPLERPLAVISQKKIQQRYITFVGNEGDSMVLLAAVTVKPLTDPQKSISLWVDFDGGKPSPGPVSTWAYVYDRNGDGAIDYVAMVGGAAAYKPADFPENFPDRRQPMTADQANYFVGHCRIVFNHWADDNLDGKLDAVVQIDMDPKRDWVDRQIVVRSTNFDGTYDDVWAFRGTMGDQRDSVEHTSTRVQYHPIGKPEDAIAAGAFADRTNILQLMNRAAKECGLTARNFYPVDR